MIMNNLIRCSKGSIRWGTYFAWLFDGVRVEYTEWYSMSITEQNKVQISHDHVLIVAEKMFSKYKKLSDILKDTANYIFVDEYQDTSSLVVKILLEQSQKEY